MSKIAICRRTLGAKLGVAAVVSLICFGALSLTANASGKVGLLVHHMSPNGIDAESYSDPGWGGGLQVVAPFSQVHNLFAFTFDVSYTNLLSENVAFFDGLTGLRVEQQTSQSYVRLAIGGRVGAHGRGFIRPFAGATLGLAIYHIGTDVVIPDDSNRENEIRQDLSDETKTAFGYGLNFGLDMNFSDAIAVEIGTRYLKNFNVPQQLGADAVEVSPEYYQIYFGLGVGFDFMKRISEEEG
jgi:opacity protein-like surface antigen